MRNKTFEIENLNRLYGGITMNKITCICLGVRNMENSVIFYRDKLGFQTDEKRNNPEVIFFNTPGTKFKYFHWRCMKDISMDNHSEIKAGFRGLH